MTSPDPTRQFLVARSRWTKRRDDRYSIPFTICSDMSTKSDYITHTTTSVLLFLSSYFYTCKCNCSTTTDICAIGTDTSIWEIRTCMQRHHYYYYYYYFLSCFCFICYYVQHHVAYEAPADVASVCLETLIVGFRWNNVICNGHYV